MRDVLPPDDHVFVPTTLSFEEMPTSLSPAATNLPELLSVTNRVPPIYVLSEL
mgnify:CR=1 FL=1